MVAGEILVVEQIAAQHQIRIDHMAPAEAEIGDIAIIPAMGAELAKQRITLIAMQWQQIVEAEIVLTVKTRINFNARMSTGVIKPGFHLRRGGLTHHAAGLISSRMAGSLLAGPAPEAIHPLLDFFRLRR